MSRHRLAEASAVADTAEVGGGPARSRHRRTSGAHARRPDAHGRAEHHRGARRSRTQGPAGHRRGARRGRTLLLVAGVAAGLLAVPAVGVAAGDQCRWRLAAHQLIISLDGRTDDRSTMVRNALTQAGVGPQLPADCTAPDTAAGAVAVGRTDNAEQASETDSRNSAGLPAAPLTATSPTAKPAAQPTIPPSTKPTSTPTPKPTPKPAANPQAPRPAAGSGTDTGTTAAATFGWGTPVKSDDFAGSLSGWDLYDGPGHAGNGRRSPSAATVANGILTITGDANGTTDGMEWGTGQKFGRWEGRVRAPASDPSYNALLLLWPDAENFPVGGEIDFMEMTDHTRQSTNLFLHYGSDNDQVQGEVKIDATQWHNWAVEWTPKGVTTYVDGKPWFHTDDAGILPPGPMHLCIQLDWFPKGGSARQSQMQVDWVRQYAV